jgi:hypothetical protein
MLLLTCPKAYTSNNPVRCLVLLRQNTNIRVLDVVVSTLSDVESLISGTDWLFGWSIFVIVKFEGKHMPSF